MPHSYPRISTRVLDDTETPIRTVADLRSAPDSVAGAILESIGWFRSVRIDVGPGVRAENLGKLALVARRVQHADVVELVGTNAAAVDDAKALLLLLWTTG